jgi:small ligand-binding sensory domain FIST
MAFAAACSQNPDSLRALREVTHQVASQLGGQTPDLSLLFVSKEHAPQGEILAANANEWTQSRILLGCAGEMLICDGREYETGPILSLWSGVLPGARLSGFHVEFERTPDGPICSGLPEGSGDSERHCAVFALGDPFSCAVDPLITRLADEYPQAPLIGGMASAAAAPGGNSLILNNRCVPGGAVGVVVEGGPRVHTVVSQGCREIGTPFVVTRAQQNLILELGGKPALKRLEEVFGGLGERDRKLVRQGLHVGIVMNEYQSTFQHGDFLIANVLGADQESGAIALASYVRTGQTVQFHIRDAETADADLRRLINSRIAEKAIRPRGALLFSCNGRGTRLFPEPHHDAGVLQELCGPIPVAGFFAQGEFGPVGDRNYIHGFTASIALFE